MPDPAIIRDASEFAVRWLHVVTAIASIGASFYRVARDFGLRRADDLPSDMPDRCAMCHARVPG